MRIFLLTTYALAYIGSTNAYLGDGILYGGGMMARENGRTSQRLKPSGLAELREAIDGLILLAGWQQELLGRAKALLPQPVPGRPPHRPRRKPHRQ
jgi:hypothetical protein